MKDIRNVDAWFELAPPNVVESTKRLLDEVERMRGSETVYPAQGNILNALAHTPPRNVRAVILGQDPYHGPGQAMGLSFSVPAGHRLPPSLRNIYKELSGDLGCPAPRSGDLTSWADQGVLLLNTVLTVREHAAGSHAKLGWQTLTSWVVEACAGFARPVVFLAWGRPSVGLITEACARAANTGNAYVLASTHPSPLSATRATADLPSFIGSRPFSRTNAILEGRGQAGVRWESVC